MRQSIDKQTAETLRNYLEEVKSLPNESAKRHRFSALLGELFPGNKILIHFASGVEKIIKIESPSGTKKGRADAYFGNLIIEFEKLLSRTLTEANEQLQEYIAGAWQKDPSNARSYLAIASDGVEWYIYRPWIPLGKKIEKENIELDLLRIIKISEDTLGDFWLWLTSILFREQQLEPTGDRFRVDFGATSPLYREGIVALRKAWTAVSGESEANLAFETWQKYLTVTYGSLPEPATAQLDPETGTVISPLENLFLRHTYLVCLSQLMVWAMLSGGKTTGTFKQVAQDTLSGKFFKSKRIANLVDEDFFHWIRRSNAENILIPTWERILSHLIDYDLKLLGEDVLKGIYQELIDPKDRHDLGEYYTPDWLCERVVEELLPKAPMKPVLDPSCGSGGFLRASIAHYLKHNSHGTENTILREIIANVVGIDIHPVAVTISKATYILALGKLISSARNPIHIPVYLADSLFLPREIEADLYQKFSGIEISFGPKRDQKRIVLPEILIHHPELFDEAITTSANIAADMARGAKETPKSLQNALVRVAPNIANLQERDRIFEALWSFVVGLSELIIIKQDSIWSFIILNSYRPAMLKYKFDYILGNPPWLSYRFVSDPEYQNEIKERAVKHYRIAPKSQKLYTQMELATLFLAHSMATFATTKAKLGFVMPRSVLNGDHHVNLIERKYSPNARFKLTQYWDLKGVTPLFNVPSCVLFASYSMTPGNVKESLKVLEWKGKLQERDVSWRIASKALSFEKKTGNVIYLGKRSALSTGSGQDEKSISGSYQKSFRQGATIVPRNFYFVEIGSSPDDYDPDALYWVKTDPIQKKQAKETYKEVEFSGMIEGRFLFNTAISRHVVPFGVLAPAVVALPIITKSNGSVTVITSTDMMRDGFREFGSWMKQAEDIWHLKREKKSSKQTVYDRLDYQKELTLQNVNSQHLVLYNHSGTNLAASYFDRTSTRYPFIVDVKLYWAAFDTREEADYLTAILNAEIINLKIKPFQSLGLQGERDIHKKVLELPIPPFDKENEIHKTLAKLSKQANGIILECINSKRFPLHRGLRFQRSYARMQVSKILNEINDLVLELGI